MLDQLTRYLYPVTPYIIPQWESYIKDLQYQKNELKRRFLLNHGADTRAMRLLADMIGRLDFDYLSKQRNDIERFMYYFDIVGKQWDEIFRPGRTGRAYRHVFYRKQLFASNEYICSTEDIDYLKLLPLDRPWEEWKKVQPVHIWYHDSNEYTLNLLDDTVGFKYVIPNYAIIFIDSISLAFKYYKYSVSDIPEEEEKTRHNFLHRHVFSFLFEDLQNIWLFNQILGCAEIINGELDDSIIKKTYSPESDRQYGYKSARYELSMQRLIEKFQLIKDGNLYPSHLLSSNLLTTGSILEKINYGFTYLDPTHIKQYEYTRILRDLPFLKLIYMLYKWRIDSVQYNSIRLSMEKLLRRYLQSKPWSTIADPVMRTVIEEEIKKMYNAL